jgi:hypothetical protein
MAKHTPKQKTNTDRTIRHKQKSPVKGTTLSLSVVLENFPKLAAVMAACFGSSALAHEWGYYSALGLELNQVPMSAGNQLKNLLALIPNVLRNNMNFLLPALLLFSPIIDQAYYKKASWFLGIPGLITALAYNIFSKSSGFRLDGLDYVFLAILLRIFSAELSSTKESIRKNTAIGIALVFLPIALFAIGERSATEFKHEAPIVYVFLKNTDTRETALKGSLLRSYEKQLLISNEKGEILFQPIEKIARIEVLTSKKDNIICREFPTICFLK